MVVTESNAMGTPVIAYDVNGLRDSVSEGENGIIVNQNTPESMADSALRILQDPQMIRELSASALDYSRQFSWDKTADYIQKLIESS